MKPTTIDDQRPVRRDLHRGRAVLRLPGGHDARHRHGVPHRPGYFRWCWPSCFLLGLIVSSGDARRRRADRSIAWRGMAFILPAPIFFRLTVRGWASCRR